MLEGIMCSLSGFVMYNEQIAPHRVGFSNWSQRSFGDRGTILERP